MKRFEYQITQHSADAFDKVVYFCSESGECSLEEVSKDQTRVLTDILNGRGSRGGNLSKPPLAKMGLWPIGNVESRISSHYGNHINYGKE